MHRILPLFLFAAAAYAQTLGVSPNAIRTVLTADVGISDTLINVAVCGSVTAGMSVNLDSEIVYASAVNTSTCDVTVVRAQSGTVAARHYTNGIAGFYLPVSSAFLPDAGYASFTAACTAAGSAKTLLATTVWPVSSGTYPCAVQFLQGGKLQVAASSTAAMTGNVTCPTYQQCFDTTTNAAAAITFTKPPENGNPAQWGAVSGSSAQNILALRAAYAALDTVHIYAGSGLYGLTAQFSMNRNNTSLLCEPGAGFDYAGSTDITAIVYAGRQNPVLPLVTNVFGQLVSNCTLTGNSHVTGALIYLFAGAGNQFTNLEMGSNSGGVPARCVMEYRGNTNKFTAMRCDKRASAKTALVGFESLESVDDIIDFPKIEVVTNSGILVSTNGFVCGGNVFTGGTSEGNGTNITVQANCYSNQFNGVALEAGTIIDISDGGGGSNYAYMGLGNMTILSTATNLRIVGGDSGTGTVTISAGAKNTFIENAYICTLVDNGSLTTVINRGCTNGNAPFPTQFSTPSVTIQAGMNQVTDTGASDGHFAGVFTPSSYHGANPVTCPLTLDQSNDMMHFYIKIIHAVVAGANKFNFCGFGEMNVTKASSPGTNLAARPAGAVLHFVWIYGYSGFLDMGQ